MSAPCYQTVGIVLGPHENSSVVGRLHDLLSAKGIGIVHEAPERFQGDSDWKRYCASTMEDFSGRADLICCVGGDGTMLDAIALYHPYQKPFTGINLGHLGFLIDLPPAAIDTDFASLLMGQSCSEKRALLEVELIRDSKVIDRETAVNEVVFRNSGGVSMINLDVIINDHPVHTESGDGLLVSTPTGSTAYNLSSGGPILEPCIDAIVLTPICPNYLNSRPVVIGSASVIKIQVPPSRRASILVGCDGQRELKLKEGDIAKISKHPLEWTLLHPQSYEYFSLLRSKLKWGLGPSVPDAT